MFVRAASLAQETKKVDSIKIVGKNVYQLSKSTPLYILDDVEMPSNDLGSIKPDDIELIEVLKDKKAELYGEKGKNGVVIITTKKYKAKKSKAGQ